MGYAQSKLVTEILCSIAARETSMVSRILRIGQVSGDATHGIWNATEAIPLTVQSARTIDALPSPVNDEKVSWLPVNDVAAAVIDLSYIPAEAVANDAVFHVSHPKSLSWNSDVLSAMRKAGLKFETVKPTEWVKRLKASSQDPAINPPVKLLEYFERKYARDEVHSAPCLDTREACKFSTALRETRGFDAELLGRFLVYWREQCWER
jgi:thioester reductase-like protein